MNEADKVDESNSNDHVILVCVSESYWMLEGEGYLAAMLSGQGYFPTPIKCQEFSSRVALRWMVERGGDMQ